jgi:hypothetical protein
MGRGPSDVEVQRATRRALDRALRRFGGNRQGQGVDFIHRGVTYRASTRLLRASNGEAALMYCLLNTETGKMWESIGTWDHLASLAGVTVTSGG